MALSLYSRDVSSVSEVSRLFGEDKGLLVIRPGRPIRPWFTIPEGGYALVTRFGQDLDYDDGRPVWPAGFFWGPPWVQVSNVVTKQSVVLNMPIKGCKTQDNVTVEINLAIVFRLMGDESKDEDPMLVRKFVYNVTPRGLEQQLRDACEEATRSVARSMQHQEVYGLRTDRSGKQTKILTGVGDRDAPPEELQEGDVALRNVAGPSDDVRAASAMAKGKNVAEDMRRTLNEQFQPQGVDVTDVIITDVMLPEQIVTQMAQKTMVISQNAAQKMNQEYEMLTLKQEEEIATLKQKKMEEREQEKQSGLMEQNEVQVQLDKMKAETNVLIAKIKQESRVRVQDIVANGQLEEEKLKQEKAKVLTELDSNAKADAERIKSEADLCAAPLLAEGPVAVMSAPVRRAWRGGAELWSWVGVGVLRRRRAGHGGAEPNCVVELGARVQSPEAPSLKDKAPTPARERRLMRHGIAPRRRYEAQKMSEAKLQATKNAAKASELMAKAEGVAAPKVEARKQFETRQKQMLVWKGLARNKELVISGESSDELNTIMLCDAILDSQANDATKSQVLAEMLVMQRGSKVMLNLAGAAE